MAFPEFKAAFPYQKSVLTLPVTDLETAAKWYSEHFGMVEVERKDDPTPTVILERDGTRIGFSVNGGDASQDGAAILVRDIQGVKEELESRGLPITDLRVDERDGQKLHVFFVVAPDGLCFYFHEPIESESAFASGVGEILSADIAVPDHERELRFYSQVLTTGATPLWRDDLMNNRGTPIIGLGERVPEYECLPLQWMPHIQVADVAASAARAVELGGEEVLHGKDEDGASQWAVLLDPSGAAFGLVPVLPPEALPPASDDAHGEGADRVGCIAGVELTVSDAASVRDFYRDVIGWSVREVGGGDDPAGPSYAMVGSSGRPAAKILPALDANPSPPSAWLLQLPVSDLAESVRRVQEQGGEVLSQATDLDSEGATATVRDPVGARLTLVHARAPIQ